ncbi:uncharacterized protein PHACADRAFT_250878 [Phanerochaete carnosa HHB-10118-sp]|uniref:ubiquitinyl hydrolase 1 n=1 Tax=Phanerochaete carnosa (strain HHB-10118-sp) TaxID=650164 RepID=K5WLG2_PHACS|nr:uncharacterized protein PHACADRAFT_250878 [Phanerochaete carnosa HHB-10118-sp]EKM60024.1 hypothetical protein PHACADRAFT_250878 [Phanerochaete carnosa HHB-10118-sp]
MSITKSVFDGLTANRRCCVECGYTEAVMHFSFDSWQLALPRANACGLEDCLADYTRLEVLTDCICRRCSMEATYEKYAKEGVVEKPISPPASSSATLPTPDATDSVPMTPVSKSKKKRAQESRKLASRVKDLIDAGRVEEDVKGVQVVKVARASTKQAMVARPPPILVLHLNRSLHFGGVYGAAKNSCRVSFAEILDLTPYTTSGMLNTSPQAPISGPGFRPSIFMQSTGVPKVDPSTRTLYRLSGVVVHYGQHSFGHYVCYRRRPRPARLPDEKRWLPPGVRGEGESGLASLESIRGTGRGWLRVSDDDVRECGIESVLQEGAGAFMLYYERIVVPPTPPPGAPLANGQAHLPAQNEQLATPVDIASTPVDCVRRHGVYLDDDERTPRCSEETLKPANGYRKANGSIDSLASTLVDDVHEGTKAKGGAGSPAQASLEPRLVRSVSLGPYHADNRPPPERSSEVQKVEEHEESAMPNSNAAAADGDRQLNAS